MGRDLLKTADAAEHIIPYRYNLTIDDIFTLRQMIDDDGKTGKYKVMITAFRAGFILGARAQKRGRINVKI